jgi:hypothetical protein
MKAKKSIFEENIGWQSKPASEEIAASASIMAAYGSNVKSSIGRRNGSAKRNEA